MGTKIEWTKTTWNIITGCEKYSEGCRNCYAERMHKRLMGMGQSKYSEPFNSVRFNSEELNRDFGKKQQMVFKQWGEWSLCPIKGEKIRGRKLMFDGSIMFLYNKKSSGALLDGVEYKQFPSGGSDEE